MGSEYEVRHIDILSICYRHSSRVQLFPGLIYRIIKPKVVLVSFVWGKIVLIDAKVNQFVFLCLVVIDAYTDVQVQWTRFRVEPIR